MLRCHQSRVGCEPLLFLAAIPPCRDYSALAHGVLRFGPESGTSQNTVYTSELNLPASGSSNIHFSPFPHGFHTGLNLPIAYPNSGSSYFSANSQNNYGMSNIISDYGLQGSDTR